MMDVLSVRPPSNGETYSMSDIQAALGGDADVEMFSSADYAHNDGCILDDGLMVAFDARAHEKSLPLNMAATLLLGQKMYGPVFIFDATFLEGE